MRSGWWKFLAFLLPCMAAQAGPNEAATAFWSGIWDQCYNVHLEGFDARIEEFKKYLVKGRNWEKRIIAENAAIDSLIKNTCVPWAADPNGSEPLKEFRKQYKWIYSEVIGINDRAKGMLLPTLANWTALEVAEAAAIEGIDGEHVTWSMYPCSVAFTGMETRIQTALKTLEDKLAEMKGKCPIAADELPTVVTTKEFAEGSGKRVPATTNGKNPHSGSDITGTQKAIEAEEKSKAILKEQK